MTDRFPRLRWLSPSVAIGLAATVFVAGSALARNDPGAERLLTEAHSLARLIKRIDRQGATTSPTRFKTPQALHLHRVPYSKPIGQASQVYGIPKSLIAAVIKCESDWNYQALSKANARGLMQVLPRTALGTFGVRPEHLWDPAINISVGTAYLRLLANRYHGKALNVIAAYNAGPTRVDSRLNLPRETRRYIQCVRLWQPVYERTLE